MEKGCWPCPVWTALGCGLAPGGQASSIPPSRGMLGWEAQARKVLVLKGPQNELWPLHPVAWVIWRDPPPPPPPSPLPPPSLWRSAHTAPRPQRALPTVKGRLASCPHGKSTLSSPCQAWSGMDWNPPPPPRDSHRASLTLRVRESPCAPAQQPPPRFSPPTPLHKWLRHGSWL